MASQTDNVLDLLAGVVTQAGASFSVTLMVGGTVVSGKIIGSKEYFQGLADEFGEAWEQAGVEGFDWRPAFEGLAKLEAFREEKAAGADREGSYLYLKDAVIFGPGDYHRISSTFWRGLLTHVSAWMLGEKPALPTPSPSSLSTEPVSVPKT